MKKYRVYEVTKETHYVDVEANSREEALEKATEQHTWEPCQDIEAVKMYVQEKNGG